MPQETNLNVAPYFDDFDPQSNYYKVLFKPAYPVQARELNNLQSILQNQIEDMGTHFFKEGAKVIPGQLTYLPNFYAVQIEPEFLGIPVDLYLQQLVGKKITGATSGVTAEVVTYITDQESENGNFTIYVDYYESSTSDNATQTFLDNEVLLTNDNISFTTTFIAAGEGFSKTLTTNANRVGSAFALSNGVYFLRGYFVDVEDQILILDQYGNKPNYRVGLNITENLVSSDIDPSLNDNAKNFTNYTAPGADRLEITAVLSKKDRNDYNDQNFVQLAEVQNGILREINTSTDYNILGDELAKRTFDESGHYYVKEFVTTVRESLNNGIGNRGIYNANQTTTSGQTPSEDKVVYKISPGKAYVKGYPVETRGATFLDAPKARTTKLITDQSINFGFGPTFTVNNVTGAPTLGFDSTNVISLRSERVGAGATAKAGKEIGVARVYDFVLETGSYEVDNKPLNQWDLTLFDVQTYNEFEVNTDTTLTIPTFIEGESSGATGYLRYAVSAGTAFTAYNVTGTFSLGERLKFNGETTNGRTVIDHTAYETSDVQSVYSIVGSAGTFTADLLPQTSTVIGIASISAASGGISTVTNPVFSFPGIVTTGNLVRYSDPTADFPSLARVTEVQTSQIKIEPVQSVTAFINGSLPTSNLSVTDFEVVEARVQGNSASSGNLSDNQSLFSVFPKRFIQNVDLTKTNLVIRRQFDVQITDGSTATVTADPGEVFLPFDEERYSLINDAGELEVLSADRFTFSAGSTQITIGNLSNNGSAKLQATLRKSGVTPKVKTKKVVQTLDLTKSNNPQSSVGAGTSTLQDGLTYGNFPYGTRVQDRQICMNVPDVIMIYGVFQGEGVSTPTAPSTVLASMDGPTNTTNDLIIGEEIVGSISGARAIYVTRLTDSTIEFIYKNRTPFEVGEVINFSQSGVSAVASSLTVGSKNVTSSFNLRTGQEKSMYNFSFLERRDGEAIPTNKLRVYYMSAEYESSDTGDITVCNSYNDFNYSADINSVAGFRNTDLVDARPRVSRYTVGTGTRSPFEFYGRQFNGGQHSSKNILASDESISCDYNYYLGRIDRIYLDRNGIFTVKEGAPADVPSLPKGISGALNIANIYHPPYTVSVSRVRAQFINHKRYQMSDISKLEQRIKNLEYYTSLNQLESTTLNQFIPDANGLNRFRSGIFVDNFGSLTTQDLNIGAKNSIDRREGILRPTHYTTAMNLTVGNTSIAGIGTTTAANQDSRFAELLGTNVRRSGQMVTLDYSEQSWLRQPFATRSESVTPFLVQFWEGTITFDPTVDVWIDVNRMELRDVLMEGSFQGVAEAMRAEITTHEDGSRSGLSPVIWKAWETTGVDVSFSLDSSQSTSTSTSDRAGTMDEFEEMRGERRDEVPGNFSVEEETSTTTTTISGTVGVDLNQRREGTQTTVTEQIDTSSLGDRIVSREVIHFMRARNIQFTAKSMKPFTQVYGFFDNVDVNKYCMPKLVEVTMTDGVFEVGEAVGGLMPSALTESSLTADNSTQPAIVFRVADPVHKFGAYNSPSDVYDRNPYDRENRLPTAYTQTTTVLNVDTFSLASEESPEYQGFIAEGMVLRGVNSGAEAVVTDVRLVTDRVGTLIGSFRVPSSADPEAPVFETGNNIFRLTSSETNSFVEGLVTTSAEDNFYSQGDTDNTQEVTLSLRNARVEHDDSFVETRTIGDSASASTSFTSGTSTRLTGEYTDPLAQSFIVDDETGVYLTGVDLYFQEKPIDFDVPVTVQIREVELGTPSQRILAFSEVSINPDDITVSQDASVATRFEFESPVYLEGQREYAIIILSNSTEYRVWTSRLGEVDISSVGGPEANQILVTTQRLLGSLFKSQNASTWTPSQYEDLTFELYRADFVPQGSVQLFNPPLATDLEVIPNNAIESFDRTVRVGFGTTTSETGLEPGMTISQRLTGATGKFVGYGGSAAQMTLDIISAGIGYTPSSGSFTYTGVAMTSLSGHGLNATADIYIENGVAVGATINAGGLGYQVGDILAPITVGAGRGDGIKVSISTIHGNNELTISNVQGTFGTGAGQILDYENASGITTIFNFDENSSGMIPSSPIQVISNGDILKVNQRNHGMYSNTNFVTLRGIRPTVSPTTLSAAYSRTTTSNIAIGSTSGFESFEGVGVGASNPGYAVMNSEIVQYTGVTGGSLTGITRGIDNTNIVNHSSGDLIYKYEFNGVSLRRINMTHTMNTVDVDEPRDTDFYKIKIDYSQNGTNRTSGIFPSLAFNKTGTGGGDQMRGTYNVPFSQVIPNINTVTPTGTSIDPSIRTVSATSITGSEGSFVDQGFERISLDQSNYFDSQRMVASSINEQTFLDDLPGNKSLTVSLNMNSDDSRITPAIDLDQVAVTFISNRVNQPISNYATDSRVDMVGTDPNKFMYVTPNITLENPGTSIQVYLDAYLTEHSDIRLFFAVDQSEVGVKEVIFTPFPGFGNFASNGSVIDMANNNGSPDSKMVKSDKITQTPAINDFREYKFSIDKLPAFSSFRIKLVGTSINQASPPMVRNFRALGLA